MNVENDQRCLGVSISLNFVDRRRQLKTNRQAENVYSTQIKDLSDGAHAYLFNTYQIPINCSRSSDTSS